MTYYKLFLIYFNEQFFNLLQSFTVKFDLNFLY